MDRELKRIYAVIAVVAFSAGCANLALLIHLYFSQ